MKTKLIPPLCGLLISIASSVIVATEDQASVMVFDASGSMWGQLKDGRTKIDVAKEVIGGYLKDRDQSTPLGIIAYGHHRKGDCSDIEVIAPIGKQDSSVLISSINKIKPKGKTPLTDALELAVKQIPKTAEEADIILITDGLETCDRDPCALAQKIADEGINIRAHIVGFGLSKKEVNSLSCIPEKTGGQLLRPQTGSELSAALKKVEAKPVEPTKPTALPISISLKYEAGTARPTSISYSAKNIETNEVVDLGKTDDTAEIVRGFNTKLLEGKWLLMAKGPQGSGELEITTKSGEWYHIPYAAKKADFSLKNYGPYQLGQKQSFLLELGKPMQKNLTLTAELFPANATSSKDRIEHEYLIGVDKGIHEINFKSPSKAGKYKIIVGKGFEDQVASFDIEYVENAKPSIKIPNNVKPKEKFAYELYGNWYRNNSLQIVQNGKKISDTWLQNTIEKDGTYLTAPDKDGTYDILLRYKDASGKSTTTTLTELHVGGTDKNDNTPQADKKPKKESENNKDAVTAKNVYANILYNLDKSADDLVFTCQQESCTYDDKNTGLKDIPLLKGWAIEEPYFYATAAGVTADIPTITFVNTKTRAWFIINPRQATDAMFECTEFGKKGRLSSEEKACIPKNIPDKALGNIVTQQENVEFWRTASYKEKEGSLSRTSVGKVMSAEDIADFRKKMGLEK